MFSIFIIAIVLIVLVGLSYLWKLISHYLMEKEINKIKISDEPVDEDHFT